MRIPLEGERQFVRDSSSKGLINVDNASLVEYRALRKKREQDKKDLLQCQDDINTVNAEIKEIKVFLNLILEKLNKG
jgi:hypothetical protein